VLCDGQWLVFCEVKTRRSDRHGEPHEAVTPSKVARIRSLAAQWLRAEGWRLEGRPLPVRFDVSAVRATGDRLEVEVIEGAF